MDTKGIKGVIVTPLKIIKDERGQVMHMLRDDAPHFQKFGEMYFSGINPGVTKGWKLHTRSSSNMTVPLGRVRFVLYDAREGSETAGRFQEVILGDSGEEYRLLTVPPGVPYGWSNLSPFMALVANCATEAHVPGEGQTLPIGTITYDWENAAAID